MKKNNFIILTMICFCFQFSSCSITKTYDETVEMPDVKVEKDTTGTDIVINDEAFEKNTEQVATSGESKKGITQTTKDGSEISTMQDGFGNSVETRHFFNHPNLTVISVKTFANGEKEGLAFGHNGERKKLSQEAIQIAFTGQGNEIASAVGITSTKIQSTGKTVFVDNQQPNIPTQQPVYIPPQPAQEIVRTETETEKTVEETKVTTVQPPKQIEINPRKPQITQNKTPKANENQ